MIFYLDTSWLIKLYLAEPHSEFAFAAPARYDTKPMISWLSEVEMATAIHARSSRSQEQAARTLLNEAYLGFRRDVDGRRYQLVSLDVRIFEDSRGFGEQYGESVPIRALDALHVAAALHHGAAGFATFDGRQAQLAAKTGLVLLR